MNAIESMKNGKLFLLGIDSNSNGESVQIPIIFYWLDNYLVIKCIYEYILNR